MRCEPTPTLTWYRSILIRWRRQADNATYKVSVVYRPKSIRTGPSKQKATTQNENISFGMRCVETKGKAGSPSQPMSTFDNPLYSLTARMDTTCIPTSCFLFSTSQDPAAPSLNPNFENKHHKAKPLYLATTASTRLGYEEKFRPIVLHHHFHYSY